jgi:hypothetical protein
MNTFTKKNKFMTKDVKIKINQLTAKDVILLILDVYDNPVVHLNSNIFLKFNIELNRYEGCFATQSIIKLIRPNLFLEVERNKKEKLTLLEMRENRALHLGLDEDELNKIEYAINHLRIGYINGYNLSKPDLFPTIKYDGSFKLEQLKSEKKKIDIEAYLKLAEYQTNKKL